jgi:hypothetical protein
MNSLLATAGAAFLLLAGCERSDTQRDSIWSEAPVTSTLIEMPNTDDIVLTTDGERIVQIEGAKLQETGQEGRYTLTSDAGIFRVLVIGDLSDELSRIAGRQDSPYNLIRNAFMLTEDSPASGLWNIRAQMLPGGCVARLKKLVMLFDNSGTCLIEILAIDPNIGEWNELVGRLQVNYQR